MLFVALVAIGCNGKAYQYANVITTVTTTEGTPAKGVMVYIYDETTWAAKTVTNPDNGAVSYTPDVMSNVKQQTNSEGICDIVLWDEFFFYGKSDATVYVAIEKYVDGVYTVTFKQQNVSKKKKFNVELVTPAGI